MLHNYNDWYHSLREAGKTGPIRFITCRFSHEYIFQLNHDILCAIKQYRHMV